ncbi:MAG: GSU2204 family CXXCH-containing (seleno)protein [Thermodesulfobacteriota bacterium]|nr:GSU2204 family CXXCH-containing (seleno)protein [Thermodesulfobacteriota bacterium]
MKKQYALAMALALTVSLSASQTVMASDHGDEGSVSGSLSVGASFNDDSDNKTLASEYSNMGDNDVREIIGGSLHIHSGKTVVGVEGMYRGPDEQQYKGHLDFGRILQIHGGYQEFWHRLGQDELLNIEGQSADRLQGALLWHTYEYAPGYGTDSDGLTNQLVPDHEFGINRSEFEATGKMKFPTIPGLTIGVHQRSEKREGNQQVMGMSKCGSCHIVAHDKDIDETTRDLKPFIQYDMGKLSLEYSYLYRKFINDSDPEMQYYDGAYNPLSGGTGGGSMPLRMNYWDDTVEISKTPETRKQVHSVKAKYDVSGDQSVYAGYVYAKMENNDASSETTRVSYDKTLETDYNAGMLTWHNRFSKSLMMNASIRYQTIDADDADITLPGDDSGMFVVPEDEYTRKSDENRDITTLKADLRYRLNKDITLRGGVEFEDVDREYCDFLTESDTTTYKGKVGTTWRVTKGLRFKADYKLTYVDDPYTFEDAVYPNVTDPDVIDPNTGLSLYDPAADGVINVPFVPGTTSGGIYSTYVYGTRDLNMSATPEYEHDIKLKANWNVAPNMDLAGYARYTYGDNDSDISFRYQDQVVDSGLDFTFSPLKNMTATLGYNYFWQETESAFYIPFYHG